MVSVRAVLGGLLAAGLLSAAPAFAQDGVKGVDEAWIQAVKAGNVDAVVALYAPDASCIPTPWKRAAPPRFAPAMQRCWAR